MKKLIKLEKRLKVQTVNEQPSLTLQQYKESSDINNIVNHYLKTGEIHSRNSRPGQYMDVSSAPDYQNALNIVISANAAFDALDAQIRKRFQNDPTQLLQFLSDPKNKDEAQKLGLITATQKTNEQTNQTNNEQKTQAEPVPVPTSSTPAAQA